MPAELPPKQAETGKPEAAVTRQPDVPIGDPDPPVGTPLDEQRGTALGGQATDLAETLSASRDVPEPDSLGGWCCVKIPLCRCRGECSATGS